MTTAAHKNKTFATLLALVLGGLGAHRFYLYGYKDVWAWIHFFTLPLSLIISSLYPGLPWLYTASLLLLSILSGFVEALVIGLKADALWDQRHNPDSGRQSDSNWPLALLLVLTLGVGAVVLIFAMSRLSDLMFTHGAYG